MSLYVLPLCYIDLLAEESQIDCLVVTTFKSIQWSYVHICIQPVHSGHICALLVANPSEGVWQHMPAAVGL